MARSRFQAAVLAAALLAAARLHGVFRGQEAFVATATPSAPAPPSAPAAPVARRLRRVALRADDEEEAAVRVFEKVIIDRGIDLDGDKLDNLPEWYQEGISGKGGMPTGFMRELVLRSFFSGQFTKKNWPMYSRKYTGKNQRPTDADYMTAYENFKAVAKEGTTFVGAVEDSDFMWLVLGQTPGGLFLYFMKAPPYGERPMALIKLDDVEEFFDKVDWHRLFVRMHKWNLWGNKASKFPYPFKTVKR